MPLEIGRRATITWTFTDAQIDEYIALTGDPDPWLHQDHRVIPGALLGGLFSQLLGMRLPGPGTNYLKQRLRFLAPAREGEEITATVEIVRIRPEKQLVNLRTICTNASGETVCEGEALVLVIDVPGAI